MKHILRYGGAAGVGGGIRVVGVLLCGGYVCVGVWGAGGGVDGVAVGGVAGVCGC